MCVGQEWGEMKTPTLTYIYIHTHTQAIVRMQQKDGAGEAWVEPLLPMTASNLEECVRDAQKLAQKYVDT